jgi:hypothetical protein
MFEPTYLERTHASITKNALRRGLEPPEVTKALEVLAGKPLDQMSERELTRLGQTLPKVCDRLEAEYKAAREAALREILVAVDADAKARGLPPAKFIMAFGAETRVTLLSLAKLAELKANLPSICEIVAAKFAPAG